MNTFADEADVHNLHRAQVRFGGDVFLKPGTQRLAQEISEEGEHQREGDQSDTPKGGTRSTKRHPGKRRGQNRSDNEVGPASFVNSESAFAHVESRVRFVRAGGHIVRLKIAEQKKACRVGVPRHRLVFVFAREDVKRGMFKRVITSCFEDEGKIKEHVTIIHATGDE